MNIPHRKAEQCRQTGLKAMRAQQWPQALQAFERGARLAPQDSLMWLNLGRAQLAIHDLPGATASARRAVQADGQSPLACRMLAECLLRQNRPQEAARAFDALPPEAPRDHDFYSACGDAMFQARRLQDAVTAYFQALSMKIDAALVHHRLGLTFMDLGMRREASECFRTAVVLGDPQVRAMALSLLVQEGRQTCDWVRVQADTDELLRAVDLADEATGQLLSPFALLALDATPSQQRRAGELRSHGLSRHVQPLPPAPPRRPGRVRVGYLSSDFHKHATAVLITEVLERRDRERFEVLLYSHSVDDDSDITRRVRAACDRFVDVNQMTLTEIAQRMRGDDIDIAIDLKGHTRDSRFELLAFRPARVQVAYLGYPASTGADFIDYLVGDPVVTPLEHAANYSEHIAQLPHSYQPNDRHRALPPAPPRAALGLPEDAVVLCCFNQAYKISPHMLDLWTRILLDAPNTVLWMLAWNPHAQANLGAELAKRGVPAGRVHWAPPLDLADHIARLRAADLFLDTWPCNAHTTASEALWAGVPVLTVPGATYASRVAASLVHACGLPDLACADEAQYVGLACALAQQPEVLAHLKAQLNERRMALPLFDTDRYVRDYEALLMRMFERQQAGLPPEALAAAPAAG